MPKTIGTRWPASAPPGDFPALCDICGVPFRRSLMRRDGSGRLVCAKDGRGRDRTTLERLNAQGARQRYHVPRMDGVPPEKGPYSAEDE